MNNAVIGKALPTFGEYAAQPWELHTRSLPPTASYLIANNQNEIPAGKYEDFPATVSADGNKRYFTPYMTVEQGAGNQPTKTRRPIVTGEDNGAMAFCRIAQGVSGFGYYVFHGGINPVGTLYTSQEYRNFDLAKTRDGYTCDLAERNYDFQSAVNMYNRITENGKELKISAINQSDKNVYVEKITLNGKELTDTYITHAQLMNGGELVFTMSGEI